MEDWNEKLITAATNGNIEDLKLSLQKDADIDYQNAGGWTALMLSAIQGHLEITRLLLESGCNTDITDVNGWTALVLAVKRGHLEVTRLLLDSGCTTHAYGVTALMEAVREGNLEITLLILDSGCKTDITTKDGETALHMAALSGYLQITKCLVERGGTSPFVKTQKGETPYDLAAKWKYKQYKEVMEYLQTVMSKKSLGVTDGLRREDDIVPTEIKLMTDKRSVPLYLKLLESGTEKKRDIRLVIVGKQGAGKTSLIRRLFGEDIKTVTSTNGIEIHKIKCKAMPDDDIWNKLDGTKEEPEMHARLLKPLKGTIEASVEEGTNKVVKENTPSTSFDESETVTQQLKKMFPSVTTESEVEPPVTTESHVEPPVTTESQVEPPVTTESQVEPPVTTESQVEPLVILQQRNQAQMDIEAMLKSNIDLHDKEEYATLLLWDFAGDEEFYHTHQTFLSQDAIYLVVTKLNEANDKKAKEMFQLWMNSIHCYCSTTEVLGSIEEKNKSLYPPVILVGSHKDEVKASEEVKIDEACPDLIYSYVNTVSEVAQYHIHDEYCISNTVMSVNDDNVFQKIRQAILRLARNMKTWNTDYPLKFIQLEKLLHVKKKEWPIISMAKIKQISLETPLPLNKEELELFLKYHHEIRALVYFEDLPNFIVLDTQWLADAFKCIVTADKFRSGKGRHLGSKAWNDLNNKGILYCQVLNFIIETNKNIFKFEREQNNYILNVMEKFDIIIRANISEKDAIEDTPQYYVPCMVKSRPELVNIYEMFKVERENKSAWLCFDFSFLPPYLINHLIASLSREYEIAECFDSDKTQIALFKGLAVFECKQEPSKLQKILVMTGLNLIQIQVWEFAKSAKIEKGTYKYIADFMTAEIENIIGRRFKMSNVTFEQKWACGLSSTKPEGAILMNNFSKEPMTEYRCRRCNENHTFIDEWSEQQNKTPSIAEVSENVPRSSSFTESSSQSQTSGTSTKVRWVFKSGMKTSSNVSAELTKASSLTGLKKEEINFAKMQMIVLNILADILFDLLKQDKPNLLPRSDCDITYLYRKLRNIHKHIPSNGWGGSWHNIQITDIAIGDDIERIRLTRNELQHSKTFLLSDIRYNELHNVIVDLVKRFDQHNKPTRLYTVHLTEIIDKTISADEVKVLQHQIGHEMESEMTLEVEIEH